jgi:telomere length regulation protein
MLRLLSKLHIPVEASERPSWWQDDSELISSTAGVLAGITLESDLLKQELIAWLTSTSGGGVGDGIGIRRAAIACLSNNQGMYMHSNFDGLG